MGDAWEWDLANGATVIARLELPARIESVWLGARLVSRSAAGGKGESHIVPLPPPSAPASSPKTPKTAEVYREAAAASEAEVTFAPVGMACSLRLAGAVVPPTREPDAAAYAAVDPRRIYGMRADRVAFFGAVGIALVIAVSVMPVARALRDRRIRVAITDAPAATEQTETILARDHSIAVHYPADFESVVAGGGAVIKLDRPKKLEMIVVVAQPRLDLDDARDLDRIMTDELKTSATKSGASLSTTISVDGDCQGFPGVVSRATLSRPDKSGDLPLKVVTCSMLRRGRGYFFAYFVPELIAETEEPALRAIVDATDIFELPTPFESAPGPRSPPRVRIGFSSQGSTIPAPIPFDTPPPSPRQAPRVPVIVRAPSRPNAPSTSLPAIRMGANGSVESSGPQHVSGVSPAADADRDRKMREYRELVPW